MSSNKITKNDNDDGPQPGTTPHRWKLQQQQEQKKSAQHNQRQHPKQHQHKNENQNHRWHQNQHQHRRCHQRQHYQNGHKKREHICANHNNNGKVGDRRRRKLVTNIPKNNNNHHSSGGTNNLNNVINNDETDETIMKNVLIQLRLQREKKNQRLKLEREKECISKENNVEMEREGLEQQQPKVRGPKQPKVRGPKQRQPKVREPRQRRQKQCQTQDIQSSPKYQPTEKILVPLGYRYDSKRNACFPIIPKGVSSDPNDICYENYHHDTNDDEYNDETNNLNDHYTESIKPHLSPLSCPLLTSSTHCNLYKRHNIHLLLHTMLELSYPSSSLRRSRDIKSNLAAFLLGGRWEYGLSSPLSSTTNNNSNNKNNDSDVTRKNKSDSHINENERYCARIVPTAISISNDHNNTSKWSCMLPPYSLSLLSSSRTIQPSNISCSDDRYNNNQNVPLDCQCLYNLHPSASTFDVLQLGNTDNNETPHIASIINDDRLLFGNTTAETQPTKIVYHGPRKTPYSAYRQRGIGGRDREQDREIMRNLVERKCYHYENNRRNRQLRSEAVVSEIVPLGVDSMGGSRHNGRRLTATKLALFGDGGNGYGGNVLVGTIASNTYDSERCYFTTGKVPSSHRPTSSSSPDDIDSHRWNLPTNSASFNSVASVPTHVNDFAFPPHPTRTDPGRVAFACSGIPRYRGSTTSYRFPMLDLATMVVSSPVATMSSSDALCVEYLGKDSNMIVYGHRNGSISVLDVRAGSCLTMGNQNNLRSGSADCFGSVISLNTFADDKGDGHTGPGNLLLAKGSFGTCHLFDLRMSSGVGQEREEKSLLRRLTVPPNLLNRLQSGNPGFCSGMAIDPTSSIMVTPCSSMRNQKGDDGGTHLGIWSLQTGHFVSSYPLNPPGSITSTNMNFCELSKRITYAFDFDVMSSKVSSNSENHSRFSVRKKKGCYGLWMKCGNLGNKITPLDVGGIHHVSLPGRIEIT